MEKYMKRQFRAVRTGVIALLAALALAGCTVTEDNGMDMDNLPLEGDLFLKFRSSIPAAVSSTRSLSENQEKTLHTVDVLVFEQTGSAFKFAYRTYGTVDPENSGATTLIRAKVLPTGESKHNYVLLANLRQELNKLFAANSITAGMDKDAVMALIQFEAFDKNSANDEARKWDTTTPRYLPMWGDNGKAYSITSSVEIESINQSTEVIKMLRAVARVDVAFDQITTRDNFLVTQVMVYRAGQKGAAVPLGHYSATDEKVNAPTIPGGTEYDNIRYQIQPKSTLKDAITRQYGITNTIYLAESMIKNESAPLSPADRLGILVAGVHAPDGNFAAGTETWYRLDFYHKAGSSTPATLVDILRNHWYKFTVDRIAGNGYPDWETAAMSEPININDYVLKWEEDFGMNEIWYDGHTIFGVSPTNIDIPAQGTGDITREITIFTNSIYKNVRWEYVPVAGDNSNTYVYQPNVIGYDTGSPYSFLAPENVGFSNPSSQIIDGKPGVKYTFSFKVPPYKNTYDGPTPRKMQINFTFFDDAGNVKMVVPVTISQIEMGWYVDDIFFVYLDDDPDNRDYRKHKIYLYAKGNFENLLVKAALHYYPGSNTYDWLWHRAVIGRIENGVNLHKDVYTDFYDNLYDWGKEEMGYRDIDEYSSTVIDQPRYGHYNFTTYEDLPWRFGYTEGGGISTNAAITRQYFYSLDGGGTWQGLPDDIYRNYPGNRGPTYHMHDDFYTSYVTFHHNLDLVPPLSYPSQAEIKGDGSQPWIIGFIGRLVNIDDEKVSVYAVVEDENGGTDIVGKYTFTDKLSTSTETIVKIPLKPNTTGRDRTLDLYISIGGEEESKIRPFNLERLNEDGSPSVYYRRVIQKAQP